MRTLNCVDLIIGSDNMSIQTTWRMVVAKNVDFPDQKLGKKSD